MRFFILQLAGFCSGATMCILIAGLFVHPFIQWVRVKWAKRNDRFYG